MMMAGSLWEQMFLCLLDLVPRICLVVRSVSVVVFVAVIVAVVARLSVRCRLLLLALCCAKN